MSHLILMLVEHVPLDFSATLGLDPTLFEFKHTIELADGKLIEVT